MKDVAAAIFATLFVLISLMSLISADPTPGRTLWGSHNSEGRVSELELRYALKR
jgi:hypothetical protein